MFLENIINHINHRFTLHDINQKTHQYQCCHPCEIQRTPLHDRCHQSQNFYHVASVSLSAVYLKNQTLSPKLLKQNTACSLLSFQKIKTGHHRQIKNLWFKEVIFLPNISCGRHSKVSNLIRSRQIRGKCTCKAVVPLGRK